MGWEMMGVGWWMLGVDDMRDWMLNVGWWVLGDECWVMNVEWWWCVGLNVGGWVLDVDDVWDWMLGDGCWVLNVEWWWCVGLNVECWVMMMCGFTMNFIETINTHHPPSTTPRNILTKMQRKRGEMGEKTSCLRAFVSSLLSNSCKGSFQKVLCEGSKGRY